jgi:hypothetical protein
MEQNLCRIAEMETVRDRPAGITNTRNHGVRETTLRSIAIYFVHLLLLTTRSHVFLYNQ